MNKEITKERKQHLYTAMRQAFERYEDTKGIGSMPSLKEAYEAFFPAAKNYAETEADFERLFSSVFWDAHNDISKMKGARQIRWNVMDVIFKND